MRFVAFGDIHDYVRPLEDILNFAYESNVDLVLVTGDIGSSGIALDYVVTLLDRYELSGIGVYGNHENPLIINSRDKGLKRGKLRVLKFGELIGFLDTVILGICGNRGSGKKWSHWRDSQVREVIEKIAGQKVDIVLSHEMPLGYADTCKGKHCGQYVLRELIERIHPKLFLGGHLHTEPQYALCGETLVVKVGAVSNRGFLSDISFFAIGEITKNFVSVTSYKYTEGKISQNFVAEVNTNHE